MRRAMIILSMLLLMAILALVQDVRLTLANPRQADIPPIVINPIAAEVGDQIEILGLTYQIIEMEFVRYDTEEAYKIKFPTVIERNPDLPVGLQALFAAAQITTRWVGDSQVELMPSPHQVQISGFSAGVTEARGSGHVFDHSISPNSTDPGMLSVSYTITLDLIVAVGPETVVSTSFPAGNGLSEEAMLEQLIDVIPLFDVISMRDIRIMQIEMFRTLLNYVEIRVKDVEP